jgi:hypothetical protein
MQANGGVAGSEFGQTGLLHRAMPLVLEVLAAQKGLRRHGGIYRYLLVPRSPETPKHPESRCLGPMNGPKSPRLQT